MNLRAAMTVVSMLGLVACSGGGGGGTGGGSGTGGGTGTGGGSGMAGGSNGPVGSIGLTQFCTTVLGVESCSTTVNAFFITPPASNPCTTIMFGGGCSFIECPVDAGLAAPLFDGAGTVTVTGTRVDGGSFRADIDYRADGGGYLGVNVQERLWNGGETFTASAAGSAAVPAFSGRTVTAPSAITLTSPTCTNGSCGAIRRTQPLTVSWTGGAGTSVNVSVISSRTGDPTKILTCTLTSSPGTIPANALGRLNQSDAGYTNVFTVLSSNTNSFNVGSWNVGVTATTSGASGVFDTAD